MLPTPNTPPLNAVAQLLPTPTAGDAKSSWSRTSEHNNAHPGTSLTDATVRQDPPGERGHLNPCFVEWMQAWPIGATDCESSATESFHAWLQLHSDFFPESD